MDWAEGVAIAQALCEALVARSGEPALRVPELDRIEIQPDGTITLEDGAGDTGRPPVEGVGRVLLAVVPEHRMPVQLRLVGLTAVSSASSYGSVEDLSAALDYFARPDRPAQIRAVGSRCAQLPPAAIETPPLADRSRDRKPRTTAPRRGVPVLGLAAVVIIVGAAALTTAWLLMDHRRPGDSDSLASAVSGTAHKVGDIAAAAARSVGNRLGLARTPPPPSEAVTPARTEAPADRVARRRTPRDVALPPVRPVPVWNPLTLGMPVVDETVFATVADDLDVEPSPASGYYTDADDYVVPPALQRPRLPRVPAGGLRLTELPHVDLLVTETGEVEWVRLWPADASVHSAMMLSAIKNWRFEPARRNGIPVRYRQTIALTSQ
jgi:hypothetical protein